MVYLSQTPRWINGYTIEVIHQSILAMFGGIPGIRDVALLESALAKPQHAYGDQHICALAAAYTAGIVKNHPFMDGNKRVGFVTACVFLEYNGYIFSASEAEVVVAIESLAAGTLNEEELVLWFKDNTQKAKKIP